MLVRAPPPRPGAGRRHPPRTLRPTGAQAAFGLLLALVLAAVFLNSWGQVTLDTQPEVYFAPGRTFLQSLSAWEPSPFLGQPGFNAGLAPVAAFVWFVRVWGTPVWLTIRIVRAVLLAVAFVGAAKLFDDVAGRPTSAVGRVVTASLYVANPYVLVSATSLPVLLPYALFPWLLLAVARSIRGGWRAPAAFALVFFLMAGMNGGIVPMFLLLGVPLFLAYERATRRVAWSVLLSSAARCLGLATLVSLYWIVPTVLARRTAATIAFATERPEDVASTSSYAETIRLLGIWPLYGRRGLDPFLPNTVGYVTNPLVLVASFALPVAAAAGALASRARARALGVLLFAAGAVVMVGIFPGDMPTPFGRVLRWALNEVPGAIGFRTTNKAGALAALGLALLVGLGAVAGAERVRRWPTARRMLAVGVVAVLALAAVYPAWSGKLYGNPWKDIPDYWYAAAADLEAGDSDSRVLLLPGATFASYRWGKRGPTDLSEALLSRPSALRTAVPAGSAHAANYLAALDEPLHDGSLRRGALPVMARYLGANEVLVRNDLTWEEWGGVRPAELGRMLVQPGIRKVDRYGRPGENTTAPTQLVAGGAAEAMDARLPPLVRYEVEAARPMVRAEPVRGTVLIDGDNYAVPALAELRMFASDPAFRLLGSMTAADFRQAIRDGARIVVTDTNRRRLYAFRRPGPNYSATLPADQTIDPDRDLTFRLFGDRSDAQTVSVLEGAAAVTGSGSTAPGPGQPSGLPEFAFDQDPRTAWLSRGLGPAVGQRISIRFDRPISISELTLRPILGPGRRVSRVRIVVGSRAVDARLPGEPSVRVAVPPVVADGLTLRITGVRGAGQNPVGFWEIGVPGVRVSRVIRLPRTFSNLAATLDPLDADLLAQTRLDVVFVREAGRPGVAADDEEPTLDRLFDLPQPRDFSVIARAALSSSISDSAIDRLIGSPSGIVAESSSRSEGELAVRASAAFDGSDATAWVPAAPHAGQFIQATFPARVIDRIVVRQGLPSGMASASFISRVDLALNGGVPRSVGLSNGTSTIRFDPQAVSRVRLAITGVSGLGGPVGFRELEIEGVRTTATDDDTPLDGCAALASLDGAPMLMRLPRTLGALRSKRPVVLLPCTATPTPLAFGEHRVTSSPEWDVDLIRLSSTGRRRRPGPAPPAIRTFERSSTGMTLTAGPARAAYYLVLGQGYDSRWTALMDGEALGPPIVLDGYSVGWRIDDLGPHTITVRFGPQRDLTLALAASAVGLALVAALLLLPTLRGRRGAGTTGTDSP